VQGATAYLASVPMVPRVRLRQRTHYSPFRSAMANGFSGAGVAGA